MKSSFVANHHVVDLRHRFINKNNVFYLYGYFLFFLTILTGCSMQSTVDVELIPKQIKQQQVNAKTSSAAQIKAISLSLDEKWWQNFADTQLPSLIELAFIHNPSLSASLARVKSAEYGVTISTANLYPDLSISSSASSDIEKPNKINNGSLGFSSSWELDLWGNISSLEDKANWDYVTQQAVFKARSNTVAGSVTTAWVGWLAELEKQRLFAAQYLRTKTALEVINRRFAMGKNSITDVWQQKRLLESIISQQAVNNLNLLSYKKQLALWLGMPAEDLPLLVEKELPMIEPITKLNVPLISLQNRPDLQQAYGRLQSNNANLAAAVTEKFPRLTLRANYSTSKSSVADLFDDWGGNLVASLALPLFDSGTIDARIKQRQYSFDASFAEYQQAWLDAIYAVENTVINEQQYYQVAEQINVQLTLAQKTERVVSLQYLNGKSTYLALLRAQESSLSLERQRVDAQKNLLNNRIQLYRELTHGNFNPTENFAPIPFISEQQIQKNNHTSALNVDSAS